MIFVVAIAAPTQLHLLTSQSNKLLLDYIFYRYLQNDNTACFTALIHLTVNTIHALGAQLPITRTIIDIFNRHNISERSKFHIHTSIQSCNFCEINFLNDIFMYTYEFRIFLNVRVNSRKEKIINKL